MGSIAARSGAERLARAAGLLAVIVSFLLGVSAGAQGNLVPARDPGGTRVVAPAGGSAVVRDAATGDLRAPTADEAAALAAAAGGRFPRSRSSLRGVRNADGSWTLDLRGHVFAATAVGLRGDGSLAVGCVAPGGATTTGLVEARR